MKVIKLGGSLLDDAERRTAALRSIANAWMTGAGIVLVHGGGKNVDRALAQAGIAKKTHAGLRITDDATLEIVIQVLAGSVNKSIVAELATMHIRAAGISGSDAGTLVAEEHPPIDGVELGHVGRVICSDMTLIRAMLDAGILPVVSSVAQGPHGTLLNVNADSAAAAIAAGVGARNLQFITDVAGLLDERGAVVPSLTASDAQAFLASDIVSGGMRPKLQAALGALKAGVKSIAIGTEKGGTHLVAA